MVIEGKVAELLDKYTLVANVGREDGVKTGMTFEVYEEGPMVTDPDTGEELGKPETVKIRLTATDVKEKMSIMNTKKTVTKQSLNEVLTPKWFVHQTKQEKMNTDEYDFVREDRTKVKKGDLIRQVIDEEDKTEEESELEDSETE